MEAKLLPKTRSNGIFLKERRAVEFALLRAMNPESGNKKASRGSLF